MTRGDDQLERDCLDSLSLVEHEAELAGFDTYDRDEAEHEERVDEWRDEEADAVTRRLLISDVRFVSHTADRWAQNNVGTQNVASLLPVAEEFRKAAATFTQAAKELEHRACEELPPGSVVGNAEIMPPSRRYTRVRWSELMPAAISRLADEGGLFFDSDGTKLPSAIIAANLVDRLHQLVGWSSPKRPGLAEIGLELEEYAEVRYEPSVRWRSGD